ncbi:MAG: methionyl-tRNA formyltransferase [Clostridiales bacterium]|nr:methionyl-tRNA formyltransferase [Clostridiales bacterium]
MKAVFFGTPDFAVPVLKALAAHHNVLAAVTQPDKPKNRGKKLIPTPVKQAAEDLGIEVLQPVSAKTDKFIDKLKEYNADVFVVAAYGQILPKALLEIPEYGSINVHGSLLPKYRGAAPVQQAIMDSEKTTGITIMYMAERLDAGDMLLKAETPIGEDETGGELEKRLSILGADALIKALRLLEEGKITPEKQDEEKHTYAHKITKETGLIDFSKSASEIKNLIRALNPSPAAYTFYNGEKLKVFKAETVSEEREASLGEIISADKKGILVKTGKDCLLIKEIQAPGSKIMPVSAYILGHKIEKGKILGE